MDNWLIASPCKAASHMVTPPWTAVFSRHPQSELLIVYCLRDKTEAIPLTISWPFDTNTYSALTSQILYNKSNTINLIFQIAATHTSIMFSHTNIYVSSVLLLGKYHWNKMMVIMYNLFCPGFLLTSLVASSSSSPSPSHHIVIPSPYNPTPRILSTKA